MAPLSTKVPERKIRLKHALKSYRKGEITLMKASETTGISLWKIMQIVREKRIPMHYTLADVEKDIKSV